MDPWCWPRASTAPPCRPVPTWLRTTCPNKKFTEPHLGGAGLDGSVRRGTGALAFHLSGAGLTDGYELLPFHSIAHGYYNLYWRVA